MEIARRLRPIDFDPPPRVDCVVLWLARRTRPLVEAGERRLYEDFIEGAFGSRGPRLRDGLRGILTHTQQMRLARDLRFTLDAPASQLSFDQWLQLFRFVAASASADSRMREQLRYEARRRRATRGSR